MSITEEAEAVSLLGGLGGLLAVTVLSSIMEEVVMLLTDTVLFNSSVDDFLGSTADFFPLL